MSDARLVTRDCPRDGCDVTLEGYEESIDLSVEMHIAEDHELPWKSIPGYPRGDV